MIVAACFELCSVCSNNMCSVVGGCQCQGTEIMSAVYILDLSSVSM